MDDTTAEDVEIKMEIDDETIGNFMTANMISHDTTVTCGRCKETMSFEEYNVKHRSLHYNLCWLDGTEDEIDFTDVSRVKDILQLMVKNKNNGETKIKFKCYQCNDVKYSVNGFAKHVEKCKNDPVNDTVLGKSKMNSSSMDKSFNVPEDDATVTCGLCGKSLTYAEYQNEHRKTHYNLCWLDDENELDYENINHIASLLRKTLPLHAERDKKVCFTCEWCNDIKKSVMGFSKHVKNCTANPKKIADVSENSVTKEGLDTSDDVPDYSVTCGLCQKSMLSSEYNEMHRLTHNNLCWLNGDEKPDFNDENVISRLLRKLLPTNASKTKTVNFACEWCKKQNKSVVGFASHTKRCQFKPTVMCPLNVTLTTNSSTTKSSPVVTDVPNLESKVTCGRCFLEMSRREYFNEHSSKHYNLCWIDGEDELDFRNYDLVLSKVKECIPFKEVRKRKVILTCEKCKTVKKSVSGFASHVIFCFINSEDMSILLTKCKDCGNRVKPSSMASHKLKTCKGNQIKENCDDSFYDRSYFNQNNCSFQTLRRKRRLPNILTFHPDTNHASDYRDCVCRLCDYVAPSVSDILNHILNVHSIDINRVDKLFNLKDCISFNTYDLHKNIYIKSLLNYYNFSKKCFWTANYHEDFQTNVELLNNDEAMNYLPSIQESCKIFNSDNEEITVSLFKSTPVNDMHWLFTGGPIWAMSWCPVPEDVQTQYLAISCHRKPDMEHKELSAYKYPSLVQLWDFNSLNNINCESICDVPYMSYGLAHEFGAVWDMEWCPSGAYEPKKKIGLLALSTSSGDCPIFAMPHVAGDPEMFYIYKAKPVIARNFECESTKLGVQCTKVCWKAVSPFNTLICGYSNGMVSVFVINFKSMFFNNDVLYPSHTFRASKCCITGLSVNYLNSLILASTSADGSVILWDLKSTEYPMFQKKFLCPSDCAWLQQCYTLAFCTKGVNPNLFKKVRTINFFNCDDDVGDYNPDLHVLKKPPKSPRVVSSCGMNDNGEKLNCENNKTNADKSKRNANNVSTVSDDSNDVSDDETYDPGESSNNSNKEKRDNSAEPEDPSKNFDDDDWYGPSFFQRSIHWSVSGSNWMNVIATGDENGLIYEKLFLPGINQLRKENCSTHELMVRKLTENDTTHEPHGYRFTNTAEKFGLQSRIVPPEETESLKDNVNDEKPLLRFPLASISRVSWNQNLNSFRWLAIGTQGGFALVSPSQTIPDSSIQLFYKIISSSEEI